MTTVQSRPLRRARRRKPTAMRPPEIPFVEAGTMAATFRHFVRLASTVNLDISSELYGQTPVTFGRMAQILAEEWRHSAQSLRLRLFVAVNFLEAPLDVDTGKPLKRKAARR